MDPFHLAWNIWRASHICMLSFSSFDYGAHESITWMKGILVLDHRNLSSNQFRGSIPLELGHIINLDTLWVLRITFLHFRYLFLFFVWQPVFFIGIFQVTISQDLFLHLLVTWSTFLFCKTCMLVKSPIWYVTLNTLKCNLDFRNLSRNHLDGSIPSEFGNLKSIQTMWAFPR